MGKESVYFINSAPHEKIGGAEVSARLWCQRLLNHGYRVVWSSPLSKFIPKEIEKRDIRTTTAPILGYKVPQPQDLASLTQEISQAKPEAVIIGDINHWTISIAQALLNKGLQSRLTVLANRNIFPRYKGIKIRRWLSNLWLAHTARNTLRNDGVKMLAISNTIAEITTKLELCSNKPQVYTPASAHTVRECEYMGRKSY